MDFLWTLSELRTPLFDKFFSFITLFGEETIAIGLICAIFWCINKNLAYIIGFSYFVAGLLVQGLKITCRIERPWILDNGFKPVAGSKLSATGYSFPSGHTQSATSLFSTLAFRLRIRWLKIICCLLIILVGLSRMYLGVHTPQDVLTSFALSVLISLAISFLYNKVEKLKNSDIIISSFFVLIAASLMLYSYSLYSSGVIELHYASDCFKAAGAGIGFAIGYFIERKYVKFNPKAACIKTQLIKYAIGISTTLALKSGLKLIIGTSILADSARYAIVILWVLAVYPIIIKKYFSKPENSAI